MAIVNAKSCEECQHSCKIKIDDTLLESLKVISCPKGSKGFRRIPKSRRKKKKKTK